MNNFTFSTPRICDCGGDLSKQWYIYFRAKDESTGDIKQFRYKLGINRFKKKRERQEAAKAALATVISMLEDEGWNPFEQKCETERRNLLVSLEDM